MKPAAQNKTSSSNTSTQYTLKVGYDGAPRLQRLNDMHNPLSLEFIQRQIDLKNKKILDLGCGIGVLSSELAQRSLPNGGVTAVDQSQEQLDIAQAIAQENNIHNIKFIKLSAFEAEKLETTFDLIYCRFLLAHLRSVPEVIQKLKTLMHANSILICEEPNSVYGLYCNPFNPIFEQFRQAAIMHVKLSPVDFTIGTQLNSIFSSNHLKVIDQKTAQSKLDTPHLKDQLWLGIIEVRSLLIENNFLNTQEIEDLVLALKDFSNHSHEVGYWECSQIAAKLDSEKLAQESVSSTLVIPD